MDRCDPRQSRIKTGRVPPATIVDKARSLSRRSSTTAVCRRATRQSSGARTHSVPIPGRALQTAFFNDYGKLLVTGTAQVPNRRKKPDCVVVGYVTEGHRYTPFAVFRPKFERLERQERFGVADLPSDGFAVAIDASNLPKGALVLRAWSIDVAQQTAFPLAGSINIHNGSTGPSNY